MAFLVYRQYSRSMITVMLMIHIILLCLSLVATTSMVILALMGRGIPALAQKINLIGTVIGIVLGALLLIQHPLGSRCLELTTYIVVFAFTYRFIATRTQKLLTHTSQATD